MNVLDLIIGIISSLIGIIIIKVSVSPINSIMKVLLDDGNLFKILFPLILFKIFSSFLFEDIIIVSSLLSNEPLLLELVLVSVLSTDISFFKGEIFSMEIIFNKFSDY